MAQLYRRPESDVWWMDYRDAEGERQRKSTRTTDKKEAQVVMAKAVAGVKAQLKPGAKSGYGPTLKEAFKRALKEYPKWRDAKAQGSLLKNQKAVELEFGSDRRLSTISRDDIYKYQERMEEDGRAGSTINQRISHLSVLFDQAIDHWGFRDLQKPRIVRHKPAAGRTRRYSPEEEAEAIQRLEQSTRKHHKDVADLVKVLSDTGMRYSEAQGISRKTYSLGSMTVILWDTKNNQPRAVPMTPRVFEVLSRRKDMEQPFGMLTHSIVSKAWRWVRAEMGFADDKQFVLHVTRHTVGSRLADAGVSGPLIQAMLGHKSIATTQKYIHVSAAGIRGLADILAASGTPQAVSKGPPKEAQKADSLTQQDAPNVLINKENNWQAQDSKSPAARRAGSIPALGTNEKPKKIKNLAKMFKPK